MQRLSLGLLTLAAVSLIAATPAAAQVRVSVSARGVYVGNARPGYPYGYNRYGARPYYRNTIVVERPYAVPVASNELSQPAPYAGPGVTIRNPAASAVTLSYTVDGSRSFDLAAGESQQFTEKGKYLVEFDRGGSFGPARYTISEGLYEFTPSDHGWELYRQRDSAAAAERLKSNPLPATAP